MTIAYNEAYSESAAFIVCASSIAIGNNKSMISIMNTGNKAIRIREIFIINTQTTAVTGIVASFGIQRITSHSVGTDLTTSIFTLDTKDTLDAGVTVRTGATVGGASATICRRLYSSDEWGPGTLDTEGLDQAFHRHFPIYANSMAAKPFTIRQNEGLHIIHLVNSTAGSFDIELLFTQEDE
jgi:hypothetical protein